MDDRTCPVCKALNGYQWVFETGKDVFGNDLIHPAYGIVWNTQIGSQAHGHTGANCRCHITSELDLSDLLMQVKQLHDEVIAEYGGE
jgi:hypothetical protein